MKRSAISAGALALALTLLPLGARALDQGVTPAGVAYLSGGTDGGEQRFLADMRTHYSVWLIARSNENGRALDGTHVRVIDASKRRHQLVFDRTLAGPWLLLDLPAGRFEIEARLDGELQRWSVVPHGDDALPHLLYLDVLG